MSFKFLLFFVCFISFSFAQNEVRLSEEFQTFSIGSKNAIVVTIPFGNKEIVEKALRSELKDWGGKYDSKGDEFFVIQAVTKFMGPKPFDTYAKIISSQEGNFKIAFTTDLGGAFLSSREHSDLFRAMSEKIQIFAKETAVKCVENDLDKNKDVLSDLEKDQRSLEKDKKNLEEDIEDYKKKIADAEDKIRTNNKNQDAQKAVIKTQQEKLAELEKRLKSLR